MARGVHPSAASRLDGRVVVARGVNDTTIDAGATGPRLSLADSARYLARMLEEVRDAAWESLVIGPPPVARLGRTSAWPASTRPSPRTCRAAGVGYVRVFEDLSADPTWRQQVAADDGAHPGADCYRHRADLIWPRWLAWITAGCR